MITRNFNLYLNAGHSVPLVINVNQYDSGEQWVFTLYNADGTKYTPSTGAIVGIKSDGLGIINSGSVVDGNVVINETQQMTAAVGKAVFELMIDSQTHGTANFVVLVEEKPGNNADLSESDLSLLQEAIDATSPLPTGGSVGQVLTKTANGSAWSDAGTPTQEQVADAVSDWADEHITVTTGVVIDTSLSVAGAAADSKKVGDEITDLKSQIAQGGGLKDSIKSALLQIAQKVAYIDDGGQDYYGDLYNALYSVDILSISAVYNSGDVWIYDTNTLNDLKQYLTVVATYDNGTSGEVSDYTLSGTLTAGQTCTITVAYSVFTTTFDVVVSPMLYNWDFTESMTDKIRGTTLNVLSGSGYSNPSRTSEGLVFNQPTQELTIAANTSYVGRTIEIDVAEFDFAGDASYHARFLMNASSNASNGIGAGALIFRSGYGWSAYGFSDSNDNHTAANYRKWSLSGWGSLYASDKVNAFDGKTVKIYYGSDGHTRKLYLDNELIATITDVYFNHDSTLIRIGGAGALAQSSGDQCYNMTITGIRVYSGEV